MRRDTCLVSHHTGRVKAQQLTGKPRASTSHFPVVGERKAVKGAP